MTKYLKKIKKINNKIYNQFIISVFLGYSIFATMITYCYNFQVISVDSMPFLIFSFIFIYHILLLLLFVFEEYKLYNVVFGFSIGTLIISVFIYQVFSFDIVSFLFFIIFLFLSIHIINSTKSYYFYSALRNFPKIRALPKELVIIVSLFFALLAVYLGIPKGYLPIFVTWLIIFGLTFERILRELRFLLFFNCISSEFIKKWENKIQTKQSKLNKLKEKEKDKLEDILFNWKHSISSYIEGKYSESIISSYSINEDYMKKNLKNSIVFIDKKGAEYSFGDVRNALAHFKTKKISKKNIEPYLEYIALTTLHLINKEMNTWLKQYK